MRTFALALCLSFSAVDVEAQTGSVQYYGSDCFGHLTVRGVPKLGGTLDIFSKASWVRRAGHNGVSRLLFGSNNKSLFGVPLPYRIVPHACVWIRTSAEVQVIVPQHAVPHAVVKTTVRVPNVPALVGKRVYVQSFVVELISRTYAYYSSRGALVTIGR